MNTIFLTTTITDVFKSSFVDNITSFSLIDTLIAMVLSFLIGMFIYYVYRKTFSGVMYSSSFGVTLVSLTVITTFVILAVTSNVVLSLGMVGALSIVRFRTAIKEPIDISFLFWSIAVGIVLGAGMIPLAVIASILIGAIMVFFANQKSSSSPFILVVNCENDDVEKTIHDILSQYVKKEMIKSKTVTASGLEMTVEIRLKEAKTDFVNKISKIDGVQSAVLVSYNGDYMS